MYTKGVGFTWNPKKAAANFKKHKVSFEEAVTVFFDPLGKVAHDPDHSDEENRWILIGHSSKQTLMFVVHVHIETKNTIRIISARKATKRERYDFESL